MIAQNLATAQNMLAQAQAGYATMMANPGASAQQRDQALLWVQQTERSLKRVQQLTYGPARV